MNNGRDTSEDTPEVIEQDIIEQTIEVGSGCGWTGIKLAAISKNLDIYLQTSLP